MRSFVVGLLENRTQNDVDATTRESDPPRDEYMSQPPFPMVAGASVEDLKVLGESPLLAGLGIKDLSALVAQLDQVAFTANTILEREEAPGDQLCILLEGHARVRRHGLALNTLGPGDYFGGLSLARVKRGSVTVESVSIVRLARLPRRRYETLAQSHPSLALHLAQGLIRVLGEEFNAMTDRVGAFLNERSLPRRANVTVKANGEAPRIVATGTKVEQVFASPEVAGTPIIGALVNGRPVGMDARLVTDAVVSPVTARTVAGREMVRRSVGLLVLEACGKVAPALRPLAGAAVRGTLLFRVPAAIDRAALAQKLESAIHRMREAHLPFREEVWDTEEARSYFREQNWEANASLLRTARAPTQLLMTCGDVYAISSGPLLSHAGQVDAPRILPHPEGFLVDLGDVMRDELPAVASAEHAALASELVRPRFGGPMQEEHRAWLDAMLVDSVGAFNERCIAGRAAELIRTSEGFQEKQIGRLADAITSRKNPVRIICVAGPSSSGKTTFIRRLTVQLEINRTTPVGLSLDDYYVDRERTPKDADGSYDFEHLDAVNLPLFQAQAKRLLAGESVKLARYDFRSGKSLPEGGSEARLGPRDVILIEGIHGLNPAVVDDIAPRADIFNVFVHPATTLPLDGIDCFTPEQTRLVRRIVRDRHSRGYKAEDTLMRWPSVVRGESLHIYPYFERADFVFDTALAYELGVTKVYAERYLLEVPERHPAFPAALQLRNLMDRFVAIYPDQVPPTSLLREFIGGTSAEY
ncbi:MAG: cyclic nucleotide-binding domain-containing protein [Polyangiaceae bacterium]